MDETGVKPLLDRWAHLCQRGYGHGAFVWALLGCAACSGGASEPAPRASALATLMVRVSVDTLRVSQATQGTVEGRDQAGQPVAVGTPTWSSSAPGVAAVTVYGVVTATGVGSASISAEVGGKRGEVQVRVVPVPVSLVSVSPTKAVLLPGTTTQLLAVALDAAGRVLNNRAIAWLSSDPERATVSETGMVAALTPGLVSVSAISEDVYASVDIRVSGPPGPIAKITISPPAASLTIGATLQLATTLEDAIGNVATDRPVTWVSAAPAVAVVSAGGQVTAVTPGTAQVQAVSEGKKGLFSVTVVDPLDAIKISAASPLVDDVIGDTLEIVISASARNDIAGVQARVNEKEVDLVAIPVGFAGLKFKWVGALDLSDFPFGPYTLVVTALDRQGHVGIFTIVFKKGAREGKGGAKLPPRSK